MLYPDVLGDVEVKKEVSGASLKAMMNKEHPAETFDKTGWTPYWHRLPQYEEFPILEMRDGWKAPSEMDWQSNYNPATSPRNTYGFWWRSVPKARIEPSIFAPIKSPLGSKPN